MFNLAILKDTINFGIPLETAFIAELNEKYANRVLHDVGLCVGVFDLMEVDEGKVRYGDGLLFEKLILRLFVFRPFTSELLDTDVASMMQIDAGEVVRARAEVDEFHDDEPGPPEMAEGVQVKQEPRRAPYQIICLIAESGLGNVSWWNASDGEDTEGDAVMEE
ncbi:polymerase III polypeptide H [Armillaria nabsnona]|nr:polymerase III polypeptide H [Armillaria nabsnona]